MLLEYKPASNAFVLRVPRADAIQVDALIKEHGFDFSDSASTAAEAILFTHERYAAYTFYDQATPQAQLQLARIHAEITASWNKIGTAHIDCPPDQELAPFQIASVEYALRRTNTLVGDQPGLGKTPIAVCIANEMRAKRVLVICPASIRGQWVTQINRWSTLRYPRTIHPVWKAANGIHPNAHYTIISYDLASDADLAAALIRRGGFDLIILDEVHYLKTSGSLRTRTIFGGEGIATPLAYNAGAVVGLSGTPLLNRPREAYTIAKAFDFESIDCMSENKFKKRFNPRKVTEGIRADGSTYLYADERSGRHAELQNRLRGNIMVRHLKREVLPQLKLPIYDLIYVDETRQVKAALEAESLLDIDPAMLEGSDFQSLGHISTVRMMMGIAMAPQVADWVDMLIEGGEEKLVVFAWHVEVMRILAQRFEKHGVITVGGFTPAKHRPLKVQEFKQDRTKQIFLGQMIATGIGTDGLQDVAFHALIAEPDWVPGNNIQCFDRLDRMGQGAQVQGDIFVAPNSFAEKVLADALRKNQINHKVLDRRPSDYL